jgi:hypothetical protein
MSTAEHGRTHRRRALFAGLVETRRRGTEVQYRLQMACWTN